MPKRLPLYTLFLTTLISVTGNAMTAIAIPWFVLETTGSPVQAGITAFFSVVSVVIAAAFGGTLVDRAGYKRMSVIADVLSGLTVLLIPVLYLSGNLEFWQLLVLVFFGALLDAPGQAARNSMMPELAQVAGMSLERATAITQVVSRSTTMIGAPLAGALIVLTGAPQVLLLDAATFFISALGVQLLIPAALLVMPKSEPVSYWQDLRAGFQFIRRDRLILTIILVVMVTNMVDGALFSLALPVFAEQVYADAFSLGAMMGVFGAAALVGTLLYSRWGVKLPRRSLFTVAFMLLSVRFFLYMLQPPLWLMLVFIGLTALGCGPLNPIIDVLIFERVPGQMRARVLGFITAGVLIAIPPGTIISGFLLEHTGLVATLFIYGVIYVIATSSLIFLPAMKELDRPSDTAEITPGSAIATEA